MLQARKCRSRRISRTKRPILPNLSLIDCILPAIGLTLTLITASTALASSWQGTETEVDGHRVIHNPTIAMEAPEELSLQEMWRISGDDENVLFGVIGRILTDDERNLYILDRQLDEILIFDRDGNYLRSIGRSGEGPGEFRNPSDMFFLPGGGIGVLQLMPGRIVGVSLEGASLDDTRLPGGNGAGFRALIRAQPLGDSIVLASSVSSFEEGTLERLTTLSLVDHDGEESTRYFETHGQVDFAQLRFEEEDLDGFSRYWQVTPDGHIVVAPVFDAYRLNVYDEDGSLVRVIEREYEPYERNEKELKRAKERFGININGRQAEIVARDVERPIEAIFARPGGELWVLSSRGDRNLAEGELARLDVFDSDGRFTRQLVLHGEGDLQKDGFYVLDDRVIVVRGLVDAAQGAFGNHDDEEESDEEGDLGDALTVVYYRLLL